MRTSTGRGGVLHVAAQQRDVRLAAVHLALVGDHAELAEARRHQRLADAPHVALVLHAVADQLGDGEHLQIVLGAEFHQVGNARHGAVFVHDFADHAGGDHARQPRQVHRGFRLPGAHQHAAAAGAQRKHMPGPRQVGGTRGRIDGHADGARAIVGGDAGGNALARINRLAKRGAELRGVLRRHRPDAQVVETLLGHRQADQPAAVLGHEVDRFGRDLLGGQGEVALVFAIFVVHHHHHAPGADLLDGGGDVGKWRGWRHFVNDNCSKRDEKGARV